LYLCHPPPEEAPAEPAGLADAVCAHHPGKKAVAVCAGTGDFICSLCRVSLEGKDYSVQYLDHGGPEVADAFFAPRLPRPDRVLLLLLVLSPVLSLAAVLLSLPWLIKAMNLRRSHPLFAQVVAPWRVWLPFAVTVVVAAVGLTVTVYLIVVAV
ncbi:MAG: hypothetical protein LIP77_06265, partial [Planctomycetes bacterium]|nr:hypothetical protein [Planctomycetota bacterium]